MKIHMKKNAPAHTKESGTSRAAIIDLFDRAVKQGSSQEAALSSVVAELGVELEVTRKLLTDAGFYIMEDSKAVAARIKERGGDYTIRLGDDAYVHNYVGEGIILEKGTPITVRLPRKRRKATRENVSITKRKRTK